MSSSASWKDKVVDFDEEMGRLKVASGAMTLEQMQERADQQTRRLKAEDDIWHRALTGEPLPASEDDEMRQTILGDQTTTYQLPAPKKPGLGLLAALALGAMIPGAGIAGFLIADALRQDPPPAVVPADDETADLGLGRIEDYAPKGD